MKATRVFKHKTDAMEYSFMLMADLKHHHEEQTHECPGEDWCELIKIRCIEVEIVYPPDEASVIDGDWHAEGGWFEGFTLTDPDHIKVCTNIMLAAFKLDAHEDWTLEHLEQDEEQRVREF